MSTDVEAGDVRIGEGGLLRRFETLAHLTRLRWQLVAVLVVTWAPLVVDALVRTWTGRPVDPIVRDPVLHVQLLIATPVFLFLDQLFPRVCRAVLTQLTALELVPRGAMPRFVGILRSTNRLGDAAWPEVLLALFALALGIGVLLGLVPAGALGRGGPTSAAQVWYAITDLPLFQFLLWRSLWRWLIWVRLLAGLSRIALDLEPTHPDRRGGLGFLRVPSIGYCALLLFAIASVLCAQWSGRFALGATLATFKPLLLLFGTVGTLIAFGPLLLFSGQLRRLRREGTRALGELAMAYGRRFRWRWLARAEDRERFDSGDVEPLVNLAQAYQGAETIRSALFEARDVGVLLVATLLPTVPLMLASIPREEWVSLLQTLTGGRLM